MKKRSEVKKAIDQSGGSILQALLDCSADEAIDSLSRIRLAPVPIAKEIRVYRKYVPKLILAYKLMTSMAADLSRTLDQLEGSEAAMSGKRWSKDEEESLIDFIAKGHSIMSVAASFGRTPGSISSKVSQLVGVGRVSQKVAGNFVGRVNGIYTQTFIEGEVTK